MRLLYSCYKNSLAECVLQMVLLSRSSGLNMEGVWNYMNRLKTLWQFLEDACLSPGGFKKKKKKNLVRIGAVIY